MSVLKQCNACLAPFRHGKCVECGGSEHEPYIEYQPPPLYEQEDGEDHPAAPYIRALVEHVLGSDRPLLTLDVVWYLVGGHAARGVTAVALARKHGISKQAFCQMAERWRDHFHMRKIRTQRTELARENMRPAYLSRK